MSFITGVVLLGLSLVQSALSVDRVPLTRSSGGHLLVDVEINGRGPYPLILDTGANRTAISETLAVSLGLVSPQDATDIVHSLTSNFESGVLRPVEIRIAGQRGRSLTPVLLPLEQTDPFGAVGFLGADALEGTVYEIDTRALTLDLAAGRSRRPDGEIDARSGMVFIDVQLRRSGRRTAAFLDTGAAHSVVNLRVADRMPGRHHVIVPPNVAGVDGEAGEPTHWVWLDRISFGGICRAGIWALAADLSIFETLGLNDGPAMLIGLDLLDEAQINVDTINANVAVNSYRTVAGCSQTGTRLRSDTRLPTY